jgi:hypothetical protein
MRSGKKALGDLGLAPPVKLARQALRPDLLAVLATVLVVVADPPDARALGSLEHAAGAAALSAPASGFAGAVHG